MAIRAGQAFIAVSPSFKGFRTKTEAWVKSNLRAIEVQVEPKVSKKPIVLPPVKGTKVPVDVDRSGFDRSMAAIETRLDRLSRGRFIVNVGIALAPIAAPALAAAVGGAMAGGGIGAAAAGGGIALAAVGAASLKRLTESQKTLTDATKARTLAVGQLQSAEQSFASAQRSAAGARASAARQIENAERGVASAQDQLRESQDRVAQSLKDLSAARRQAIADLKEMRERSLDNDLSIEGADIALVDARAELARVQASTTATALDLRKANLGVAEAQDRLSDARRKGADDARELSKAERGGTDKAPGVVSAQAAVKDARKQEADARKGVQQARKDLSAARADASRAIADSQAAVAAAGASLAEAQTAAALAQKAQSDAMAALSPAQKKAAKGIDSLKTAWNGFLDDNDPVILGAMVKGMGALEKALGPLGVFLTPVAGAFGTMFDAFGNAAASKGFNSFVTDFGVFSAGIIGDAATGTINLAKGFGSLLTAFMPLSTDMSGGLVVLTDRFAKWSAGLEGSTGFQSFVAYVRENGPLLLSTLGDVAQAVIALGIAAAPLGEKLLVAISGVSEFIVMFAGAHPQVAATLVAVVGLSSGVAAMAVPVARVAGLVRGFGGGVTKTGKALKTTYKFGRDFVGGLIDQRKALKSGASWATTFGSAVRQGGSNTLRAARAAGTLVLDQGRLALAYGKSTALVVKDNAVKLASATRTRAIMLATKAWTAAQWLFNAAMTANPMGLIIVGLVALGAALVVAYKKSETFRNIVDGAFRKVKGAARSAFGWVKNNWPLLLAILTGPFAPVVLIITKNFGKIKTGLGKLKDAFETARDGIGKIWDKLGGIVTKPLTLIKKALNVFFKGIDKIADFFGLSFNFRFDMGDQGKKGKKAGSGASAGGAVGAGGYAKGGVLPGWSPGRDIHHFTSPTAGNLHLSGGEGILIPEATRAVGGEKGIARINAAARKGQAFAKGGVVWPTKSKHWTTYAGHDGIDLNGPGNGMGDPYFAAKSGRVAYAGWGRGYGHAVFLATNGGPTLTYGHSSKVNVKAGQQVRAGQTMGLIGSTGRSTGPHLHFGLVGEGPDRGAAALRFLAGASMPSGKSGSGKSDGGFNPIGDIKALVSRTGKLASGIDAGPFGMMLKNAPDELGDMAADWAKKYGKAGKIGAVEGIKRGLNPWGGRGDAYDLGGLAQARGLMVKDTIRPERVLSPQQTAAFENALAGGFGAQGGPVQIEGELEMVGSKAYIKGVAKEVVDQDNYQTRRNLRTPKR